MVASYSGLYEECDVEHINVPTLGSDPPTLVVKGNVGLICLKSANERDSQGYRNCTQSARYQGRRVLVCGVLIEECDVTKFVKLEKNIVIATN